VALSVVVPVYGCRACLGHLHERLTLTLDGVVPSYEIVLVDDRSQDDAWPEIERLVTLDPCVRGIRLSRNFGQHAAITAGLADAAGDRVVVIDCDLQDPPEDIPRLLAKADEGYDIVYGRRKRKPTGWLRRGLASMYFAGLRVFAGIPIDGQIGTFSVVSRKVVEAYLDLRDQDRHYLMILNWLGFESAVVEYQPAVRYQGRSSYSLPKLIKHAVDGVFFQTTVLLRWIVYLGFCLALLGAIAAVYLVTARVVGHVYPGWTSLVVLTLLLSGFIILSTGITGLYIGKVFDQSRARPLYVIDRVAERSEDARVAAARTPSAVDLTGTRR
jgi:dolichol-phosphate mannosyltransferase